MKLFLLSVSLCLSFYAGAQIQWAIKAGAQTNTASYKTNGAAIAAGSVAGFNAGFLTKVYFDNKVAFISGLQYNTKGYSVIAASGGPEKTYRLNYVDIPLMVQFDLARTRGIGLYCKAGPVISVGLSGKETYTDTSGMKVQSKAILSVSGNHFGLFDASLNAAVGYSFSRRFFAEAAYAYGFGNIDNDPDGPAIKTRVASLSVGYFFR